MDFFYTCNQCGRVLVNDRFHLIGSEDYDLCHYDYSQLNDQNKCLFVYTQNEHMGGPQTLPTIVSSDSNDVATQCEATRPITPITPEEDFQQAMVGIDSDDERSVDSMSAGSLNDFIDDHSQPMEEEPVEVADVFEFEDFFASMPQENETTPILSDLFMTRMENEYGDSESDWSETHDEDDDRVEEALRETASDRAEARMAEQNAEIIRVPNRPFGKRVIKPRLGSLFTYPANWIKNGGEAEF